MSDELMKYKYHEIVLVEGKEATIRDIYNRRVEENGEWVTKVSYRIMEKEFWFNEYKPHQVQKLNGELRFDEGKISKKK